MHDTREVIGEDGWRDVRRTLAGTFLVALLLNAVAIFLLDRFPQNRTYVLLEEKTAHLVTQGVDWPLFGDSSADSALLPAALTDELGGTSYNYAAVGPLLLVNTAWMLDAYVRRHGAPRGAVAVHVYDIWRRRQLELALLPRYPWPYGFWREKKPPLRLRWTERAGYWFNTGALPVYSDTRSLQRVITHPIRSLSNPVRLRPDGFEELTEHRPRYLREDLAMHKELVRGLDVLVSPINRAALERLGEIADEHGFPVYVAPGPVYEELWNDPVFQDYFGRLHAALAGIAADYKNLHLVGYPPFVGAKEDMENCDHVLSHASERVTRRLARAIRAHPSFPSTRRAR